MSSFFDENGLLHVEPDTPSENGILFLSEYMALKLVNQHVTEHDIERCAIATAATIFTDPRKDYFSTNPEDEDSADNGFSHDNMTGLYCLMYNMVGSVYGLPILRWNGSFWLHPRDIMFYTALKIGGPIGSLLLILLTPFMIHSVCRPREETSGKMLWFLRLTTLNMSHSSWLRYPSTFLIGLANTILSFKHGDEWWQDIVYIYFKNTRHPIREEVRELYYG